MNPLFLDCSLSVMANNGCSFVEDLAALGCSCNVIWMESKWTQIICMLILYYIHRPLFFQLFLLSENSVRYMNVNIDYWKDKKEMYFLYSRGGLFIYCHEKLY